MANLLETCLPLNPHERALILEKSEELESIYMRAAIKGDTSVPTNAEEEVDFHYVCFVKSTKNSRIYELDGDRKCPIDKGILLASGEDMLAEGGLNIMREFIHRERNFGFSLMALAPTR